MTIITCSTRTNTIFTSSSTDSNITSNGRSKSNSLTRNSSITNFTYLLHSIITISSYRNTLTAITNFTYGTRKNGSQSSITFFSLYNINNSISTEVTSSTFTITTNFSCKTINSISSIALCSTTIHNILPIVNRRNIIKTLTCINTCCEWRHHCS